MMTPTMKFCLLTSTITPHPGKQYARVNGKIEKKTIGHYSQLDARTVTTDLQGLAQLIREATPAQHLTAGIPAVDCILSPEGSAGPSRTNDDLQRPAGHGIMVIDADNLRGENVWSDLTAACPALAGHARVEASSSSSHLFAGKERISGETGLHTFLHVADASDIPRALEIAHKRLVMAGKGRYRVSKDGTILSRSHVDCALARSSQPVYLHPELFGDLVQKKRIEFFPGAEVVDTRAAFPDLTDDEYLLYLRADDAEREALRGEAEAVRGAFDAERGKHLPGGAAQAAEVRQSKRLPPEWVVTLPRGQETTVAVILTDPKAWHGKPCRDPLEPDYGSDTVAIIYSDQDAPMIYSHAHGGRAFHIGAMPDVSGRFDKQQPDSEIQPLHNEYVRVPFPLAALPPLAAAACTEVQYRVQSPMALVAGSCLASMSVAAMGLVDVSRGNGLVGPCSVFLVEIAQSSERKSSTDRQFAPPHAAHDAQMRSQYATEMAIYRHRKEAMELSRAAMKKVLADQLKAEAEMGEDGSGEHGSDALKAKMEAMFLQGAVQEPLFRRVLYDSMTGEKMQQAFGSYPLMAILTDEGGTFAGSKAMSAESLTATLATINKAWGGDTISKDTKGDADFCRTPRVTVHLMAQPGIFNEMLGTKGGQVRDIGTVSRMLLCEPESTVGTRFIKGRESRGSFWTEQFNSRIAELLARPVNVEARGCERVLRCAEIGFSDEARGLWETFHDSIEARLGEGGVYNGVADAAGKIAENAARLAGMFALFEGKRVIDASIVRGAIVIAEWYLNEMLMFFGLKGEAPEVQDAIAVENFILRECLKEKRDYITLRHLLAYGPYHLRGKRGQHARNAALNMLVNKGHMRFEAAGQSTKLMPQPLLLARARMGEL